MKNITKILKGLGRSLGFEVYRYRSFRTELVQLVKALELGAINMVFDIGANQGQFAKGIRNHGYTGKIVSFEPLSSARSKLVAFASSDQSWRVHERLAIGDEAGEIQINIAGNSVSSSVLPMLESHFRVAEGSAYVDVEPVPIATLDSVASRYLTPESNLFIKIDTQGFEWQVLNGASKTLSQTTGIHCELSLVELYSGQRLWRDVVDRLESAGFLLWAVQRGFTNPATGQSLQINGIFFKQSEFYKLANIIKES